MSACKLCVCLHWPEVSRSPENEVVSVALCDADIPAGCEGAGPQPSRQAPVEAGHTVGTHIG